MALRKTARSQAVPLQHHSSPVKHTNGHTADTVPWENIVSHEDTQAQPDINGSVASSLVSSAEVPASHVAGYPRTHDNDKDNDRDGLPKDNEDNEDDGGALNGNVAIIDNTAFDDITMHDTHSQVEAQSVQDDPESKNDTAAEGSATQRDQSVAPQPTDEISSYTHTNLKTLNGSGIDDTQMVFDDVDVGSLLPGLEMYANDPTSTNFDDLNSLSLKDENNLSHVPGLSADQDNGNNFDDLFNLGEYGGDGGDIGEFPTGTGNFDAQFDDNFFNIG